MKAKLSVGLKFFGGTLDKTCTIEELPKCVAEAVQLMLNAAKVPEVTDPSVISQYPLLIRIVPDDYEDRKVSDEAAKKAFDDAMKEAEDTISIFDATPRGSVNL